MRPASRPHSLLVLTVAAALTAGCASAKVDPQVPANRIRELTGATPRVERDAKPGVPPGVTLDDGLSQEEAVALALWNNADFQVSLADVGFARADLVEAGMLSNPVLSLLFPLGPKQLEFTVKWPMEVLWERPRRVKAARLAADAAGESLVQSGLDLVLSTKVAFADAALAQDRLELANETSALLKRIDELTQTRLSEGDISELEARAARVDAARAQQDAMRLRHDVSISIVRLRSLLGFSVEGPSFVLSRAAPSVAACGPADVLLKEAVAARPDVRAAELGVEASAARLGWEKSRIFALAAVLDANGSGREGFEMGPGLEAALPIFNQNRGGRARAGAELQRASATYVATQQRAAAEIREALLQFEQARESKAAWTSAITVPLQQNVASAERAFKDGEVSYLFVLENSRRLSEARVRERELDADLVRARARIERAIGRACATDRPGAHE